MKERDKRSESERQGGADQDCDPAVGYTKHVKKHIQSGKVDEEAERALEDLEGPEGDELRRAEEKGKEPLSRGRDSRGGGSPRDGGGQAA